MIIAVIKNKGGTGKTTTSVSLAAAFVELGYNLLLVDMDPQASASVHLGASSGALLPSVSNVLFGGMDIRSAIRYFIQGIFPYLYCIQHFQGLIIPVNILISLTDKFLLYLGGSC